MVAGGISDHTAGLGSRIELQQPIAGAPELERAGALKWLRLEQQAPADLLVKGVGPKQRRLDRVPREALRRRIHVARLRERPWRS